MQARAAASAAKAGLTTGGVAQRGGRGRKRIGAGGTGRRKGGKGDVDVVRRIIANRAEQQVVATGDGRRKRVGGLRKTLLEMMTWRRLVDETVAKMARKGVARTRPSIVAAAERRTRKAERVSGRYELISVRKNVCKRGIKMLEARRDGGKVETPNLRKTRAPTVAAAVAPVTGYRDRPPGRPEIGDTAIPRRGLLLVDPRPPLDITAVEKKTILPEVVVGEEKAKKLLETVPLRRTTREEEAGRRGAHDKSTLTVAIGGEARRRSPPKLRTPREVG